MLCSVRMPCIKLFTIDQWLGIVHLHHRMIFRILRNTWIRPHYLLLQINLSMDCWWYCDYKLGSISSIDCNFSSHYWFRLWTGEMYPQGWHSTTMLWVDGLLIVLIWTIWYHMNQGGYSIHYLAYQFWCSYAYQWDYHMPNPPYWGCSIVSQCYPANVTFGYHGHSRHHHNQAWMHSWSKSWIPQKWKDLERWTEIGNRIWFLRWIPLLLTTNNSWVDDLYGIDPFIMGIPPQNSQLQPHNTLLSPQFAYHSCHSSGKYFAKTYRDGQQ